ncbi:MAG: MFS transporter [Geminicoccaceae bacterium]
MKAAPSRTAVTIVLLWLAGLGAAGQFSKVAVPFVMLQAEYAGAGAVLGWLLSVVSVIGMLFGMVGGILMARLGLKWPLLLALVAGAVFSWLQAFLPALPLMLLLRLLEGVTHLAIVIAAPTLIGLIAPVRWRGIAMTLWSTFFGVGFALTATFGLPFAEEHGVGALMRAHAVAMVAVAIMLAVALCHWQPVELATGDLRGRNILDRHLHAFSSPRIAAPAWGWLFYTTTFVACLAILPSILPEAERASTATAMPLLGIVVAMVPVPFLLRSWPATTIAVAGFAAAACVALIGAAGLPLELVCLLLFGVLGLVQGSSFAAIPQLNRSPEDQALANGAMAQAGNLGNMLGTPVLLAILGASDVSGLMLTLAALYLCGAGIHGLLARKRRHQVAT